MKRLLILAVCFFIFVPSKAQFNLSNFWFSQDLVYNNSFFFQQAVTSNFISGAQLNDKTVLFAVDGNGILQNTYLDSVSGENIRPVDGTQDQSGNIYVLNSIYSSGTDSLRVTKLNPNLQSSWHFDFPQEIPVGLAVDPNQDIIMLSDSDKVILRKVSPLGNILWTITNDSAAGSDHLIVKSLRLDKVGNIYVISEKKIAGDYQYSLKKFWNNGAFAWELNYNPTSNADIPHDMFIDDSCHIYITGEAYITANGYQRAYASEKIDSAGNVIWTNNYTTYSNVGWKIMADHAGNAYVAGSSIDPGNLHNIRVIKYDPLGDTLWTFNEDSAAVIQQSALKTLGFLVDSIGQSYFAFPHQFMGMYQFTAFKIDKLSSNGQLISYYLENDGKYLGNYILETNTHRVVIAGEHYPESSGSVPPRIFIYYLDDMTGINENENGKKISVYPNPVSTFTTFDLSELDGNNKVLVIYDMQGKVIWRKEIFGDYTEFAVDGIAPGLYFYRLEQNFTIKATGKLILQ